MSQFTVGRYAIFPLWFLFDKKKLNSVVIIRTKES